MLMVITITIIIKFLINFICFICLFIQLPNSVTCDKKNDLAVLKIYLLKNSFNCKFPMFMCAHSKLEM